MLTTASARELPWIIQLCAATNALRLGSPGLGGIQTFRQVRRQDEVSGMEFDSLSQIHDRIRRAPSVEESPAKGRIGDRKEPHSSGPGCHLDRVIHTPDETIIQREIVISVCIIRSQADYLEQLFFSILITSASPVIVRKRIVSEPALRCQLYSLPQNALGAFPLPGGLVCV